MKQLTRRIVSLERLAPDAAHVGESHWIIGEPGQSHEEALDVYGRHRIGENDRVAIWRIVGAADE